MHSGTHFLATPAKQSAGKEIFCQVRLLFPVDCFANDNLVSINDFVARNDVSAYAEGCSNLKHLGITRISSEVSVSFGSPSICIGARSGFFILI